MLRIPGPVAYAEVIGSGVVAHVPAQNYRESFRLLLLRSADATGMGKGGDRPAASLRCRRGETIGEGKFPSDRM